MRILVTGSEGFIGQHLMRELRSAGHTPLGADRNGSPNYHGSLLSYPHTEWVLHQSNPEYIVHLAAQVGREFGEKDPKHTIDSNATLTTLIAMYAAERGVPLLYMSSSEVYGNNWAFQCHELDGPFQLPHNLYGLTKRWGEEVCRLYTDPTNLAIARLSMPYGPGAPPGRGRRALDNFLWQAHHRKPILVHKNSERSWCWVGDTVRALRMIIDSHPYDRKAIYNVGRSDDPRSMLDLARMACDIADAPHDLIHQADPPKRQTIVKRLATARIRELGWSPTVELEEGMLLLYDWIKRFDEEGKLTA